MRCPEGKAAGTTLISSLTFSPATGPRREDGGRFVKAEKEARGRFGLRRGCSQVLELDGGKGSQVV